MSHQNFLWDVLEGKVTGSSIKSHYWKLRKDFEGVSSSSDSLPIPAPIWDNAMNFLVNILKLQIHEALCRVAGTGTPLHLCDFTQGPNLAAVKETLGRVMRAGSSKHWRGLVQDVTGKRNVEAAAMLEYFKPLIQWLNQENADPSSQ
jgi:peptidyl-dipeptidase A